jgi:hypothetical protein
MSVRWRFNRVRAMGGREIVHRGVRYLRGRLEGIGLGLAVPPVADERRGQAWVIPLPRAISSSRYCAAADRILEGHFKLFGYYDLKSEFPPTWNRDPRTGTLAPADFGKTLDYRDSRVVGDIKYLWELNRHLELVTLAQAWHLSGELRFAVGCRALLKSWLDQCPYPKGPNWTSSLEVALRLVNWSCAWHLLGGEDSPLFADQEGRIFRQSWLDGVYRHCHFIAGHLSEHSSANNHLLGELLGLMVGSITWPSWPQTRRWKVYAQQRFAEQALLQNGADGVNREQAVWYQHEVADRMLLAGLTARANGCPFEPAYWQRLEESLACIASCLDSGGHMPAFGDADDGVVVRFAADDRDSVYCSLLATGSVLFDRGDFRYKARRLDDKSRWLLGDSAAEHFDRLMPDATEQRLPRAFPLGGYYILGSDFEGAKEVRLVVDAGPLGYLSLAAHGHADALSFTLSVGGQPILIDTGTYTYHTEEAWRAYFRGTAAHNTIRVDGLDQSVAGGNFLWSRHANARCLLFEQGKDAQRIVAEHDGYRRLRDPVRHRREIVYRSDMGQIAVNDTLACRGSHRLESFWHFDECCTVILERAQVRVSHARGVLTLQWPEGLRAQLGRGQLEPPLGWRSHRFGEKVPCSSLCISGEVDGDWCGTTVIRLSGNS